jgi:hypothetical protein
MRLPIATRPRLRAVGEAGAGMTAAVVACALGATLVFAGLAHAAWDAGGEGTLTSRAVTMPAGAAPSASLAGDDVTVAWEARALPGGTPVGGYTIRRYDSGGQAHDAGGACAGTVATLTCVEHDVPAGTWRYAIVPRHAAWRGEEGPHSAPVTLEAPAVPHSFTTPAWNVTDSSTGSAADASEPLSAAGGAFVSVSGFQPAASTSRYLAFHPSGPLFPGRPVAGASFAFVFASSTTQLAAARGCVHFDVRRRSTGAVLATHGSAAGPVACHSVLSWSPQVDVELPEVTSTDVANDLEVRAYLTNDASGYTGVDLATVSMTVDGVAQTLAPLRYVDAADGSGSPVPWSLAEADGSVLTSRSGGWDTSFATGRHLLLAFPAHVPADATGVTATFTHSYASETSGTQTCWYFGVYSGATLLATHGSASSPVSCQTGTSMRTDAVALPEVDTPAEANGLSIRMYLRNNGSSSSKRRSRHDVATVDVGYAR